MLLILFGMVKYSNNICLKVMKYVSFWVNCLSLVKIIRHIYKEFSLLISIFFSSCIGDRLKLKCFYFIYHRLYHFIIPFQKFHIQKQKYIIKKTIGERDKNWEIMMKNQKLEEKGKKSSTQHIIICDIISIM